MRRMPERCTQACRSQFQAAEMRYEPLPLPCSSLYPNVDFYSGIVLRALGIPVEMYTVLFAMARTVGWVAQVSGGNTWPCGCEAAWEVSCLRVAFCTSISHSQPVFLTRNPAHLPTRNHLCPSAVEGDGCGRDRPHHAPAPDLHGRAAPQVHPRVRAPAVGPHLW